MSSSIDESTDTLNETGNLSNSSSGYTMNSIEENHQIMQQNLDYAYAMMNDGTVATPTEILSRSSHSLASVSFSAMSTISNPYSSYEGSNENYSTDTSSSTDILNEYYFDNLAKFKSEFHDELNLIANSLIDRQDRFD